MDDKKKQDVIMKNDEAGKNVGNENFPLGIISIVAPTLIVEYISFVETSKSNGAWLPIISSGFISNVSVKISIKSITDL